MAMLLLRRLAARSCAGASTVPVAIPVQASASKTFAQVTSRVVLRSLNSTTLAPPSSLSSTAPGESWVRRMMTQPSQSFAASAVNTPKPNASQSPSQLQKRIAELETKVEELQGKLEAQQSSTTPSRGVGMLGSLQKHGPVFMIYWTGMWVITGAALYGTLEVFEVDLIGALERATSGKINLHQLGLPPAAGNVAAAIALNEALEVVRFPFVLATTPALTRMLTRGRAGK